MGITEWLAFGSLLVVVLGWILKSYSDFSKLEEKVSSFYDWRKRLESSEFLTLSAYARERSDCRTEIYKDVTKLEVRFDKFLETINANEVERRRNEEAIKGEIRGMRDSLIKALTYLEQKGD